LLLSLKVTEQGNFTEKFRIIFSLKFTEHVNFTEQFGVTLLPKQFCKNYRQIKAMYQKLSPYPQNQNRAFYL